MCIVNTPIIAADSLLGVKYVLSEYQINGLELLDRTETYNGKKIYENPNCLPFVFSYDNNASEMDYTEYVNPFEYQNRIYSQIAGRKVEIYTPAEFECNQSSDGYIYRVNIPEGDYALYGNLVWVNEQGATLNVNGFYQTAYAQWLSPSVFYIPMDENETSAEIQLDAAEGLGIADPQFYVLNLNELASVTQEIKSHEAQSLEMENGYLKCSIESTEGKNAYISVPYDEGWTITLNGKEVEPDLFADCMISIPLTEGDNIIEMAYTPPGMKQGILLTIISILVLSALEFLLHQNCVAKRKRHM